MMTDPTDLPESPPVPMGPAVVAVLLHLGLLVLFLIPWRFDLSALVCAAQDRQGVSGYEAVSVHQKSGYDGQFYYLIAQRAPWLPVVQRENLDVPSRHLRVLYPGLAWFLSTGDPHKLLLVMPLLNLLAIGLLAYAGSVLAQSRGMSPWWGVLLPFAVNAGLPLFRNLTDLLGLAMLALLLVGWVIRWSPRVLFALALGAMLARETALFPLAILGVVALVQRRPREAVALLLAAGCWALWAGYLGWLYGEWPFMPASGNFGRPLGGIVSAWQDADGATSPWLQRLRMVLMLVVPLTVLIGLVRSRRLELGLGMVCAVGCVLMLVAGKSIWEDYWSYARVLTVLPLASWLACIYGRCPGLAAGLTLCGSITMLTVARGFVSG